MTAFASKNMPQPHLWWSELEPKAFSYGFYEKKKKTTDSTWKDTQAD